MTLAEEYQQQGQWRNWDSYLCELPVKDTDVVLDLGCGIGHVTRLLSEKCLQVIGVDHNPELLQFAKQHNNLKNISFINSDLNQSFNEAIPKVDGIWCSFTAAYFPDFQPVLLNWIQRLKPGGWAAFVEIDNLFGHHPLRAETEARFKAYYQELSDQLTYDVWMGSKLHNHIVSSGLTIILEHDMSDPELAFYGPADIRVLSAWQSRFDRMIGLQNALGSITFIRIKNEFSNCLSDIDHRCIATVKYVIAKKII